jgi:hypothetical protein
VEKTGDGVAGQVRGVEPDDELRDAAELRRLSQQGTGRSLLTLIYATTPAVSTGYITLSINPIPNPQSQFV